MRAQRPTRFDIGIVTVLLVLALLVITVLLASCHARQAHNARPKFGDTTAPIGPDKSHFKP